MATYNLTLRRSKLSLFSVRRAPPGSLNAPATSPGPRGTVRHPSMGARTTLMLPCCRAAVLASFISCSSVEVERGDTARCRSYREQGGCERGGKWAFTTCIDVASSSCNIGTASTALRRSLRLAELPDTSPHQCGGGICMCKHISHLSRLHLPSLVCVIPVGSRTAHEWLGCSQQSRPRRRPAPPHRTLLGPFMISTAVAVARTFSSANECVLPGSGEGSTLQAWGRYPCPRAASRTGNTCIIGRRQLYKDNPFVNQGVRSNFPAVIVG